MKKYGGVEVWWQYRGMKIGGPYGGARKNVLKKSKTMKKYGGTYGGPYCGAVRWGGMWRGGTK